MNELEEALANAMAGDVIAVEGDAAAVTGALARAACTLVDRSPLVIVPNRCFRSSFLEALPAGGADALQPQVLTASELCARIMRACGMKPPRVLLPFEEELVIEDLKVTGLKPRRIKEMVKFFLRGLSELSDRDGSWLVTEEERLLFALLDNHLASRRLMHANQQGGQALAALEENGGAQAYRGRTLIVDGYTALDAATQVLIAALQPELLVAGGRTQDCGVPQFTYYNARGIEQLRDNGAGSVRVRSDGQTRASVVRAADPGAEASAAVRTVTAWLDEGIHPEQVLVEVPSGASLARLAGQLEAAGVPYAPMRPLRVGKATAPDAAHGAMGAFAALGLAADACDVNAWRTWFGLGDWLGNSAAWTVLRELSAECGETLEDVMARLFAGNAPAGLTRERLAALAKLDEPIASGEHAVHSLRGKTGAALAAELSRVTSPEGARMLGIVPDEDARGAYERARLEAFDPAPDSMGAVRIAVMGTAVGLHADAVCHTGALEGVLPEPDACDFMTPPVKRDRLLAENRHQFAATTQHGATRIVYTWPQTMDVEEASRAKVFIERIYAENGQRMARLARSRYLDELFQTEERS